MTTTAHPAPALATDLGDEVGGTVRVYAHSATEILIVGDNLVVNRIPATVRAYLSRNEHGHWRVQNLFAYRTDRHPHHDPATEGQSTKLYRACVELAESIPARFLAIGALEGRRRDLETLAAEQTRTIRELAQRQQSAEDALRDAEHTLMALTTTNAQEVR